MKAIVIAAGPGTRLRPLTEDRPKCMLEINGQTILQRMVRRFEEQGIDDVTVIRGYRGEKIDLPRITCVENQAYAGNNILHSLMTARHVLHDACRRGAGVVVSYSDILFESGVLRSLLDTPSALALVVDSGWLAGYHGRSDHPLEEAETVLLDNNRRVRRIAKNLFAGQPPSAHHGEFIGLWKCTAEGVETVLRHFDRLNQGLGPDEPFQCADRWQTAYLTDFFQELVDEGEDIEAVLISGGWLEIDTEQDYRRALRQKIARDA